MFARPYFLVLALWFCSPALLAQVPGPVQKVPLELETPRFGKYYGPICSGDRAYSMVPLESDGTGRSDVGIIHYLDGSRPAIVKALKIPFMKDHDTFNAFFVHQGQPCIVYDSWDVGTGLVKFFLQRYDAETFEEEGTPLPIGEAQFSDRYVESELRLTVRSSPDGEKLLLCFDRGSDNGFKVVLLWVLDAEFEVVWSNAYKLPVFPSTTNNEVKLTDNGAVLLSLVGVPITDNHLKEQDDGTVKMKTFATGRRSCAVYRMRDDVLEAWWGQLPDGRQFLAGSVCETSEGLFFTGLMPVQEGKPSLKWVMLQLEEQLKPSAILSEGPATGLVEGEILRTQLCATDDGRMLFLNAAKNLVVTAFAPDGSMRWSKSSPWNTSLEYGVGAELIARGDKFYVGTDLSLANMERIEAGKPLKETFDKRPVLLSWDDVGTTIITPLIPFSYPVKKGSYTYYKPSFKNIATCGEYVDWDNERRPSLYRVTLE